MPDLATIAAFLDPNHREWASYLAAFGETRLRSRPKPKDDDAARREAVELVRLMGEAGLYAPLAEMDYRGAALARETIAVASPLADAVYAIQGLCLTPLLLAGTEVQLDRWRSGLLNGELVGGFAMTPDLDLWLSTPRTGHVIGE